MRWKKSIHGKALLTNIAIKAQAPHIRYHSDFVVVAIQPSFLLENNEDFALQDLSRLRLTVDVVCLITLGLPAGILKYHLVRWDNLYRWIFFKLNILLTIVCLCIPSIYYLSFSLDPFWLNAGDQVKLKLKLYY